MRVVHLEEEGSNGDADAISKDPNGMDGMTEEFIVCLARPLKEAQQYESDATIVVAWNILSASVHWWRHPDQLPI